MKRFLALAFVLLDVFTSQSYADVPRPLQQVRVDATVSLDANRLYTYSYSVANSAQSQGTISNFSINIMRPVQGVMACSEELTHGRGFLQDTPGLINEFINANKLDTVPVGVDTPERWLGGLGAYSTVEWTATAWINGIVDNEAAPNDIHPGFSKDGFKLRSFGLPGIRDYSVQPYIDIMTVPENTSPHPFQDLKAFEEAISVFGKTIGPTAPPSNLIPVDFISYIIDLKNQSLTLNWVTSTAVSQTLGSQLDSVKMKLLANQISAAMSDLEVFINEVENQKNSGGLTQEGYALLKFNAIYLRDRHVDLLPPITTIQISPTSNAAGWHNTDVTVALNATDNPGGSGVAKICYRYRVEGNLAASALGNSANIPFPQETSGSLRYRAMDHAGNEEIEQTVNIKIDKTAPTATASQSPKPNSLGWNNQNVKVTLKGTDNVGGSGVAEIRYSINDHPEVVVGGTEAVVSLTVEGVLNIRYRAVDAAGNIGSEQTFTVKIDKTSPASISSISPSPNIEGMNYSNVNVTLTATDSSEGSGVVEVYYTVKEDPEVLVSGTSTTIPLTAEGMTPVLYYAVDRAGNFDITHTLDVIIDKTLLTPATGLSAVDKPGDTGGAINLTWIPSSSTQVTQQRLYRSTTSRGPYSLVTTFTNNTTASFTDNNGGAGLSNGVTYYYVIRAYDGTRESVEVNEASAIPSVDEEAPSKPQNFVAKVTNAVLVNLTWTASTDNVGVDHYKVERRLNDGTYAEIGTSSTNSFSDNTVTIGKTYLYRVRAIDATANISLYSNIDLATTVIFSDDPIVTVSENPSGPLSVVKAEHFILLRDAINAVRTTAGLAAFSWSPIDSLGNPISPPGQGGLIRAQHVIDLRNNLNEGLNALGFSPPVYTDPNPSLTIGTTIKKDHIQQLRQAVK